MTHSPFSEQHATFQLGGVHCLECANAVERALKANPHITQVHFDWANNVVHVGYHAGMITPAAVEQLITTSGCSCAPAGQGDATAAQPPAQQKLQHLGHGVAMQPITMGTKYDRMQYRVPATGAHEHHHPPAPPSTGSDHPGHVGAAHQMEHGAMSGMDHAEHTSSAAPAPLTHANHATHEMPGGMDHSAHRGMDYGQAMPAGMDHSAHMGMDHDMSDPGMAAAMERDMRTKFFIALPLTIPTVLYAPLGMNLLGVRLPTFGLDLNRIMLVLSTPVVFYCGWMFIAGAYQSLRRRHAQHERADRHRRAGGVPLQPADHVYRRRVVLRGRGDADHVRAVWPLDGDALAARHQRGAARAVRPGAAAGHGAARRCRS